MKIYYAPMESVTAYPLRNIHRELFPGIDKYFSPFLSANESGRFTGREGRDVLPENNTGLRLVPQLLTGNAEWFLQAAESLSELGYPELNLNLGCPSGTVVAKGKGSGMLRDPEGLDRFLDALFCGLEKRGFRILSDMEAGAQEESRGAQSRDGEADERKMEKQSQEMQGAEIQSKEKQSAERQSAENQGAENQSTERKNEGRAANAERGALQGKGMAVSAKTRLGLNDPGEAGELLRVYNRYPLSELIVHTRVQKDIYRRPADPEAFQRFLEESRAPLVYNGDIFTREDFGRLSARYPSLRAVMLGRGIVGDPSLGRQLRGGGGITREELMRYTDGLLRAYRREIAGERNILFKLKENWSYLGKLFTGSDRAMKELRKAQDLPHYHAAVREIFSSAELRTETEGKA